MVCYKPDYFGSCFCSGDKEQQQQLSLGCWPVFVVGVLLGGICGYNLFLAQHWMLFVVASSKKWLLSNNVHQRIEAATTKSITKEERYVESANDATRTMGRTRVGSGGSMNKSAVTGATMTVKVSNNRNSGDSGSSDSMITLTECEIMMRESQKRSRSKPIATLAEEKIHQHHQEPLLHDHGSSLLEIQPIGEIRSVYRLCVGTPRQGSLAPHARGRLDLFTTKIPPDAVQGMEGYSHIWILFVFHLNTLPKPTQNRSGSYSPMKIAPPALGGKKIGVFASRSPHRPNPVGVTLAKLDRIEIHCNKNKKTISLYLSGLDLVDGTPVVDIKPYVPTYDSASCCRVPDWVSEGLLLRKKVMFSPKAEKQLSSILLVSDPSDNDDINNTTVPPLVFYGHGSETRETATANIRSCIEEVLAVDVRSQFQTKKARRGEFQAERSNRLKPLLPSSALSLSLMNCHDVDETITNEEEDLSNSCTQQIDNLLIRYRQVEPTNQDQLKHSSSLGSGAEDIIVVTSIQLIGVVNGGGQTKNFLKLADVPITS